MRGSRNLRRRFHERNLEFGELDLEHVAVRSGTEQHGLALEGDPASAGEHARADEFACWEGRRGHDLGAGRPSIDKRCCGAAVAHRLSAFADRECLAQRSLRPCHDFGLPDGNGREPEMLSTAAARNE